jgi:hypothetical protein
MKYKSYDTIHLIDVYLQGTMAGHGVHCDNISTFTTPLPQVLFASFLLQKYIVCLRKMVVSRADPKYSANWVKNGANFKEIEN